MPINCYEKAYVHTVEAVEPKDENSRLLLKLYVSISRGKKAPRDEKGKTQWNNDRGYNINVTCWGPAAEEARPFMAKGTRILMLGRYSWNRWTDKLTGAQKEKLIFEAEQIYLQPHDSLKKIIAQAA